MGLLMYVSKGKLNWRFVVSLLSFDTVLVNQKKTQTENSVFSTDIKQHDHGLLSQNKCTELFSLAAIVSQNKCSELFSKLISLVAILYHKLNLPCYFITQQPLCHELFYSLAAILPFHDM